MAVNTKYQLVKYDLSKGMRAERGPAMNQGMIPRFLRDMTYEGGNSLLNRRAATAYLGTYSAKNDLTADSNTDGDYYDSASTYPTNLCSDGERIFAQVDVTIGQSNMASPGVGVSSYVAELHSLSTGKAWTLTDIPAPRAARKLASVGPFSAASFGTGANGELLLTNWGPGTTSDSPEFFMINGGDMANDPSALKKNSVLTRFGNMAHTKVCGSGFTVSYDTGTAQYKLLLHDNLTIRSWALLTTGAGSTTAHASQWDALLIGSSIYLITSDGNRTFYLYRYATPSSSGGSLTATPTNLSATAQTSFTFTNGSTLRCVTISNQESPSELGIAYVIDPSGGGVENIVYLDRRNLTSLAAISSYSVASSNTSGYAQYITCNGNMVLVEELASATAEFTTTTAGMTYYTRNSCVVKAFVYSSGSALVEKSLFAATGTTNEVSNSVRHLELFLNSHISSDGYVCIGNNIYQVLETAAESAGVQKVVARFICKAIDISSSGAMYGVITSASASRAMREGNCISRWVSNRYVALPCGALEYAKPETDTAGAPTVSVTGMSSNDRTVVMDIEPCQMTAVQTSDETTSFGHGWSLSRTGEATVSCPVDRPVITGTAYTSAYTRTNGNWTTGEIVSYRAVAVSTAGGYESYISSTTFSNGSSTGVAAGDIGKDITVTIRYNGQLPGVKKIRVYRNRSSEDAAGDYYFLSEVDAPTGSSSSVTVQDIRLDISTRPLDPTGGGQNLQGLYVAGQRDIANVAGRNYVIAGQYAYPCQDAIGDDLLPTPMADAAIIIPARHGRPLFIDALADSAVVSTENSILGIGGEPVNALGQGALQAVYVINEMTGATGKPAYTTAGLVVPVDSGLMLVDRSRNVQDISGPISYFTSNEFSLTGRVAYCDRTSELFVGTSSSEYPWLVLDAKAGRWTAWYSGLTSDIACSNRGKHAGTVAFKSTGGYVDMLGNESSRVAAQITLGWDSFPDRFSISNLRAVHIDGYGTTQDTNATMASSFDLSYGTFSETECTSDSGDQDGLTRDGGGTRFSFYPQRVQGSSFRNVITFAATDTLYIDTIAAEVQMDTTKYSAHGSGG